MATTEYFDCCENSSLTLHDTRIVSLLCLGLDRSEICEVMNIKLSTIGGQMTIIFIKTGTNKAAELISVTLRVYFDNLGNYIYNGVKKPLFAAKDDVSKRFAASAAVARRLGK